MRKYETVFISDPDLSDQSRTDLFDKVRNIITNENGILISFDDWGNKKLAYEIRKKFRGHYICATYGGNGDLVNELERNFRLTDDVLKFMTIVLTEDKAVEFFEKEAQDAASPEEAETPESEEAEETVVKGEEETAPETEEAPEADTKEEEKKDDDSETEE